MSNKQIEFERPVKAHRAKAARWVCQNCGNKEILSGSVSNRRCKCKSWMIWHPMPG